MSLIGVFVTVSGIVIGADSAAKPQGADFEIDRKVMTCGSRAYVGVTGSIRWIVTSDTSSSEVRVLDTVRRICDDQLGMTPDLPLQVLSARIASSVSQLMASTLPKAGLTKSNELSLILAGFDGANPVVLSWKVSLLTRRATTTEQLPKERCRALIGLPDPANALLARRAPIPATVADLPELAATRTCRGLTPDHARAAFRHMVDASLDHAFAFGLERGIINWPIDFGFVNPKGVQPIVRELKASKSGSTRSLPR